MNECLTTPQHEKQIGYWVSEISQSNIPKCCVVFVICFTEFGYQSKESIRRPTENNNQQSREIRNNDQLLDSLCYTSCEALAGMRIPQWVNKD